MTALEHYEKKVGLTQRAFDTAAAKARLWDLALEDLQRIHDDENADTTYELYRWLETARAASARIAAGDFR